VAAFIGRSAERREARDEGRGDIGMHDHLLRRVARRGPLALRVLEDPEGHVEVRAAVHVDVAVPLEVFEDRDLRLRGDRADEALAAPRDDKVDAVVHREERGDFVVSDGDELDRAVGDRALHRLEERRVGVARLGAALQDRSVPALEAERGRFRRHARPRLVDEEDDADWHAHAEEPEASLRPALLDASDRIREPCDVAQTPGDGVHVDPQAVLLRVRQVRGEVLYVRRLDPPAMREDRFRHLA